METRYLKTLVAAVEEGSFSRAADVLHITQSAVSQRIKFLEEQFGQQLLIRTGAALELTPAGQLALGRARDILEKERELIDCLKGLGSSKRLALCCTPTFGMAYLPSVLNDFLRTHTDIADLKFVFLQPDDALRGLRNEEFDLAAIEHCPHQDFTGLDRQMLAIDELLLVLAPGCVPVAADGRVEFAELVKLRLFARREGCSSRQMLQRNLSFRGSDFQAFGGGVLISDDLRFIIESVMKGDGVAFVSRALVQNHLEAGRLVGCYIDGFEQQRGRSIATLPGRKEDPLLKDLLECIFRIVPPGTNPPVAALKTNPSSPPHPCRPVHPPR